MKGTIHPRTLAFTLIELLVVVAIIAILALIAIPNLLLAQTRAKVAASQSELRVLAASLETYFTDNLHYPPATGVGQYYIDGTTFVTPVSRRLIPLTTPIAYMSNVPRDPFPSREGFAGNAQQLDTYDYFEADTRPAGGSGHTSGATWRISSPGPDLYQAYGGFLMGFDEPNRKGVDYDPTNGTVSTGDIVRVGALHTRYGDPNSLANVNRPGIVRVPSYREQF